MSGLAQQIEAEIPRLRRYARVLTRNNHAVDDLVQDCLTRALSRLHLWQGGTDLRAWLFTILHNQYVNGVRRSVKEDIAVSAADPEALHSIAPRQEERLELRDLDRALATLPDGTRAIILLIGLEGMSYMSVAEVLNIPIGTVRSRLSRGREQLRRLMETTADKRSLSIPRAA